MDENNLLQYSSNDNNIYKLSNSNNMINSSVKNESEDIIKPKIEPKKPQLPKEPLVDYEKKYLERHKDDIEIQKEIEKATEGINDKDLKLKMIRIRKYKKSRKIFRKR